jgi:hypothetical protein
MHDFFWEEYENGNKEFFCIGDFRIDALSCFLLGLQCRMDVLWAWHFDFGYCF